MKGLEITVTNSDLVIKQEEKLIKLFIIFKDIKYGTKYIIFTDKNKKQIYYGSPLINEKKLVIMKFKDTRSEELVKQFLWNYLNNEDISNFELIEIPKIEKLDIIDNNVLDVKEEYIERLDEIFFKEEELPQEVKKEIIKKKKRGPILFILIIILILSVLGIYLIKNPELIFGKEIYVVCKNNYEKEEIEAYITETIDLTFNNFEKLKEQKKEIIYTFKDNDKYYEFKEKKLNALYITEKGKEIFDDENLTYKINIEYKKNKDYKLPKEYNELYDYYKNINYTCNNIEKQ